MASAYLRIKIELPDEEAARMVRDNAPASSAISVSISAPSAKQIVDAAAALFMAEAQDSMLVRDYGAEITLARR
jgi:hypothetical protein